MFTVVLVLVVVLGVVFFAVEIVKVVLFGTFLFEFLSEMVKSVVCV